MINGKIKFLTLELRDGEGDFMETTLQHGFVKSKKHLNICLCNSNLHVHEPDFDAHMKFEDIPEQEIDETIVCQRCLFISTRLTSRDSETQRFYDKNLYEYESTNKKIEDLESELKKLKLQSIKLKSNLTKAELKAKELGISEFL